MRFSTRLASIVVLLALGGCASTGVWFATTQMDMTDYRKQKIVILPVAVLQGIEVPEDMKAGLQKAVVDGLSAFRVRVRDVRIVSESELGGKDVTTRFPWTPARVAAAAAALDSGSNATTAGAIGISVTGTAQREGKEPAALSVMFVFADKTHVNDRRWAMAGTWSDRNFSNIVDDVKNELVTYFIDLKWLALTGDKLLVRETYDPRQPFVTVFGPKGIFGNEASTAQNRLRLQITGIHDDGIDQIEVWNARTGFSATLNAAMPDTRDKGPIYYSNYVNVPLASGENTVHVSAKASNGEVTQRRPINIRRTTPPGVHVLSVGVSDYDYLDPVDGAGESARKVHSAISRTRAGTSAQATAALSVDKTANRRTANQLLDQTELATGVDDQLVFYFAGRLVSVPGRGAKDESKFFFALSDASTGSPGLGSFSASDLSQMLMTRSSLAVIDACTDEPVDRLNPSLQQSLPKNAVFRVTPCDAPVGNLGDELAAWWKSGNGKTSDVAAGADWIASHAEGAFVGEQKPQLATGGDGRRDDLR